jgi:nucleoside-diphosphate-sugar epimerase
LVEMMGRLPGDLLVLGVGGKMGLSLAQAACRAAQEAGVNKKVIGVSRFSDAQARERLEQAGVRTIAADLLDRQALAALPDAENVVYMAGRKFGTQGDASLTWAANVLAPGLVSERYPGSRIVAFSTGCVYPLVTRTTGGCKESHPPDPVGEYAQSCLGRERVFEYASRRPAPRSVSCA